MAKFRKKPVVIEAVQFTAKLSGNNTLVNLDEITNFCPKANFGMHGLYIETLEGNMHVSPDDWIIKGVNGEFYPCKPDIFEKTYESVSE